MSLWIFFNFICMGIYRLYDLSCVFEKLTHIGFDRFFSWFFLIFSNFILEYLVNLELSFVSFFIYLTSLSWSYKSGHEFCRLTQVDSSYFFAIFLVCFPWVYLILITHIMSLIGLSMLTWVILVFFLKSKFFFLFTFIIRY